MKVSITVFCLLAIVSTSAFASSSVKFDIKLHEVLTLKKVSTNRFEKISSASTGIAQLDVTNDGVTTNLMKQALNESDPSNAISMELTGKNIIRIIDQKENINQEIQADVSKSFFGNLKSITIKSKTLEALYAESLKNSGLDSLRGLNISGQLNLASDVTFSDEVCMPEGDLLICNQDSHLSINIAD